MSPIHSIAPTLAGLVLVATAACATPQAGHVRFHNQAPITEVNDRRNVPKPPDETYHRRVLTRFDVNYHRRLTRWMEMRAVERAANVNSIDEVPSSTWFTNRIDAHGVTVDELRRGPNATGTPEAHLPFVVKSSKSEGKSFGLIVEDQRGKKFILKFDPTAFPEVETAADAVVQRLMWAAGYNVPENYVVLLKRKDLVLSKKSEVKDDVRGDEPMTEEFLDQFLSNVHVTKDGTLRGLASLFLEGKPVGGHHRDGVREDDPNDHVPHQKRRELRGLYAFYSWVDLTDMKVDQTLDMYVEDPEDPKTHYLMHYLVDFGKSLGAQTQSARNRALSHAYALDPRDMTLSLLSLGLWRRSWEGKTAPEIRGVGMFESETYVPHRWKPHTPNYFPLLDADRFDGFWAAKIFMRFTPEHLRAAVENGRYSDPRAVDYIHRTLLARQRKAAAHWFSQVAPLDRFVVESKGQAQQLCFHDLALHYGLAGAPADTVFRMRAYDANGSALDWTHSIPGSLDGRACTTVLPPVGGDGYTIIKIELARRGKSLPPVLVHVARDPATREPRVIGLRRE